MARQAVTKYMIMGQIIPILPCFGVSTMVFISILFSKTAKLKSGM
jgi:hypothetical protein